MGDQLPGGGDTCPNCFRAAVFDTSEHLVIHPQVHRWQSDSMSIPRGLSVDADGEAWQVTVMHCQGCEKPSVYIEHYVTTDDDGTFPADTRLVHPVRPPRTLSNDVPASIRKIWEEGSVCEFAGARLAAGAMYRAAVEKMCDELGISKKGVNDKSGKSYDRPLEARINDLKDMGVQGVADDLHEARIVGNDSLHHGLEYSAEEVADIALLIDEATRVLFVQPAERARLRESRERRHQAKS